MSHSKPSVTSSAASRLAESFPPGTYLVRAVSGGYCHFYRCRLGEVIDLAHKRTDITRQVADALGLPLVMGKPAQADKPAPVLGLRDERPLDLLRKLLDQPVALPVDMVGYVQVAGSEARYYLLDEQGNSVEYRIMDGVLEWIVRQKI